MNAFRLAFATFALILSTAALAQTPPSGSTGECKDGTYSNAPSKRGACAGHKGVKEWYAADEKAAKPAAAPTPAAPMAAKPAAPMAAPVAAKPSAPMAAPAATKAAAPAASGGNGQVWVNTSSKVYHCEGDKYYGKTKAGSYMTEAAAKAAGNRADHGKACAS